MNTRQRRRGAACSILVAALLATGIIATASPATATAAGARRVQAPTYQNPLKPGRGISPYIVKSESTYYAYVSGFDYGFAFPVMAFSSVDLSVWTNVGNVLPIATAGQWADKTSGLRFSSPSVREIPTNPVASRFALYFTGIEASSGRACIGTATAARRRGRSLARPRR